MNIAGAILVIMLPLSLGVTVDDCPPGLEREHLYVMDGEDSCFWFVMNKPTAHAEAKKDCKGHDGTLALVKTRRISDFLYRLLVHRYQFKGSVYIGLDDTFLEGTFAWADGSQLGKWQNWAPGNGPKNKIYLQPFADCVAIDTEQEGRWVDFPCKWYPWDWHSYKKPYICQYKVQHKTTEPMTRLTTTSSFSPTTTTTTATANTIPTKTTTIPKTTTTIPTTTTTIPTTTTTFTSKTTSNPTTTTIPTTTTTRRTTTITPITITTTPTTTTSAPTVTATNFPTITTTVSLIPTASPTTTKTTPKPTCPPFVCVVDCGMDGYKMDARGCSLCQCDL